MGAKDLHKIQTFVDSSHVVREDIKCHTSSVTTFGTAMLGMKWSKKKSKYLSATEVIVNS